MPVLVVMTYFVFRGFAPFGSSSILTVDMGQQYVDFFAYFRNTLLHDPSGLFYSFQKALGGDMFGTWSYYLMSPFNLLLLLVKQSEIPSMLGIITILKYGFAGLSFGCLLLFAKKRNSLYIPAFATTYALMGWMVANQLNMLWVDAVIFLPLIFLGIIKIWQNQSSLVYVIFLTLMLIDNYYMAYMICLFSILVAAKFALQSPNFKTAINNLWSWIKPTILSLLLSAWILIPTFLSLLTSKANYSNQPVPFKFEYFPLDLLGKFINGSFNFKQMSSGSANIFVASIVVILFVYYFFDSKINSKQRISDAIITGIFVLSMSFMPFDIVWHAFQMPVWYPFRFSFIFSFWMVWLAYNSLLTILETGLNYRRFNFAVAICIFGLIYIGMSLTRFQYLTLPNFLAGILYFTGSWIIILFISRIPSNRIISLATLILVVAESGFNYFNSLNNITYLGKNEYSFFTSSLQQNSNFLKARDKSLYRVGTTFSRTKNDPLSGQYNGGSIFSSTLEAKTSQFFGNLGQPNGDAYATYTNGTSFTDDLLGMKYYLNQSSIQHEKSIKQISPFIDNNSLKPDLNNFYLMRQSQFMNIFKNPNYLPLGFLNNSSVEINSKNSNPVAFQNEIYQSLSHQSQPLFLPVPINIQKMENIYPVSSLNNTIIRKKKLLNNSKIEILIKTKPDSSYYLTLGPEIPTKQVKISVNGNNLLQFLPFQRTVISNIGNNGSRAKNLRLTIKLKGDDIWLQDFNFYQVDNSRVKSLRNNLAKHPLDIKNWNQNSITGKIFVPKKINELITTIPYSQGWHLKVDNKPVAIKQWANMFIESKIPSGLHTVTFRYIPKGLYLGSLISLLTALSIFLIRIFKLLKKRSTR